MDPPLKSWTNILKTKPHQHPPIHPNPNPNPNANPNPSRTSPTPTLTQTTRNSREGISTAVVDANAVIEGGEKLNGLAHRFVTVPEVLSEIRDPVSRHRLSFLPFPIHSLDPSPDSLLKVIKFARATGDLQTLSDVDLKLIALTYTLEAQAHGTTHLRDAPPPVHTVNVKRLPEKDLPGWGSNVPNLEEWEALEREGGGEEVNGSSRILPLKDISVNVMVPEEGVRGLEDGSVVGEVGVEDGGDGGRRNRRYPAKKSDVKIEGKKMVAEGFDASNGELGDNAGDWMPAVSRSTHRRYLRRKARREYFEGLSVKGSQQEAGERGDTEREDENGELDRLLDQNSEVVDALNGKLEVGGETLDGELSQILEQMRVEESSLEAFNEEGGEKNASVELEYEDENKCLGAEECEVGDANNGELDSMDMSSQTNQSLDTSRVDDDDKTEDGSETSWMLRSLSESSVACVTGDFAMQNVLLQMGLRLLAPGGNQIRQLHRWILKCHACYTVTAEIGRIFCPKCGNGGTLRKVAVTVGENGIVVAARRPRITLRGTKFSLPLPQGGRDAISKNPVLREDQLPQKFLYPKTKKKVNKEGDDFFAIDNMFSHHTDKKAPFRPPVRKTLAVFSGKRNPNDNHFSRPKH